MAKATKAKVNAALKAKGLPVEIEQGKGYVYLIWDTVDEQGVTRPKTYETHSEMTPRISDYTLEGWVDMAVNFSDAIMASHRPEPSPDRLYLRKGL